MSRECPRDESRAMTYLLPPAAAQLRSTRFPPLEGDEKGCVQARGARPPLENRDNRIDPRGARRLAAVPGPRFPGRHRGCPSHNC